MKPNSGYRRVVLRSERKLGALRHHLITIAAWDACELPDGVYASQMRLALRECVRELNIAPEEIKRRHEQIRPKNRE